MSFPVLKAACFKRKCWILSVSERDLAFAGFSENCYIVRDTTTDIVNIYSINTFNKTKRNLIRHCTRAHIP